jgi:hypothetical protein
MNTNTTNTPARNTEALLNKAHNLLSRANAALERNRNFETAADAQQAQQDYKAAERAFLRGDAIPADVLERISEGDEHNRIQGDPNTAEGRMQNAYNARYIAEHSGASDEEVEALRQAEQKAHAEYIRSQF